ncbi:MAG: glutaminyl-peptide cyclotransferase, partial [Bacteroidia bacterium]|nr:glutaminyl-peptide cyclotransferase [Bacteroidia bacterium]
MHIKTVFSILSICLVLVACKSNSEQKKKDFAIITSAKKNVITNGEMLSLSIKNKRNHVIDSVQYMLNGQVIEDSIVLNNVKLGKQQIEATVYFNATSQTISETITILNKDLPKVLGFNIINEYPHDINSYTQGLEFYNGELYESTGQLGQSKLRKVDYKTGEVQRNVDLSKDIFGEGLTVLNDKVYQLTWQAGMGFVYDVNT